MLPFTTPADMFSSIFQQRPASSDRSEPVQASWRTDACAAYVPEQFFTPALESHARWNGDRRLLLAVLKSAVHEFCKYRHSDTRRGKRLLQEAEEWFWSSDRTWLYSFESICLYLDLEPNTIRQGLACQWSIRDSQPQEGQAKPRARTTSSDAAFSGLAA